MRCKSCEGDVPPKFAHAILTNMCPLCGEVIMDEALQFSLKELKSAMKAVEAYPDEIFDWLRSNYNLYSESYMQEQLKLVETKAVEEAKKSMQALVPKNRIVKATSTEEIQLDKDGNQINGEVIQSPDETNKFFKDKSIKRQVDNQAHLKDIVNQIKKKGSFESDSSGGGGGAFNAEMAKALGVDPNADIDPDVLQDEINIMMGNNVNSAMESDYDDDDAIPAEVMKFSGLKGGSKESVDLDAFNRKYAKKSNEMSREGGIGLIRRS